MLECFENLNLLYVEDNLQTLENNRITFSLFFKNVYTACEYQKAVDLFKYNNIDIIILDIELESEKNGFDIANKIRTYDNDLPIVFLTGHEEPEYLLKAINSHMNGYIIKPLDMDKLFNILNSFFHKKEEKIKFKNYIYNFNTLELFDINDKKISLGKKENQLLEFFLRNKNTILTREELEFEIWNEPLESQSLLKNLIASLRRKIGKEVIVNESKIGWRIRID